MLPPVTQAQFHVRSRCHAVHRECADPKIESSTFRCPAVYRRWRQIVMHCPLGLGWLIMTTLMVYAGDGAADAAVTRTGGIPLAPADFIWPQCAECDGHMQFLAQILLDDPGIAADSGPMNGRGVLLIFMCQNDPGLCDDWDATSGGNRALLFRRESLVPIQPPPEGETTLGEVSTIAYVSVDGDDYGEARIRWSDQHNRPPQDVLGHLGGAPWWIQGDETPSCPSCREQMAFVVQLEQGHNWHTAANFGGGGSAYAFACEPCQQAAFLWQR
jgi:Domain of unknown function (DUF1963)